ncbi:MAG TPA: hypothetical protein VK639_17145 [Terriglobales bacterium]|nr:hypothetical protein [Terriglobales bacterium]
MNRLIWLVCGIVLLMNPHILLAQRRGGHGGGTGRAPAGGSGTDDLKDFKRAMALQASPDQVVQFQRLNESTQVARKSAQDLLKLAENPSKTDLFRPTSVLASALDEAQTDNQKFLQTFSTVQKSGLKEITKKLGKANSDVTKGSKALTRDLERPPIGGQRISGVAEKLDKALGDLQARQLAIAKEMGIQSEGSSP